MPRPNAWRDSAQTTRLLVFDALAGIPLLLMLVHLKVWTFLLALFCFLVFGVLERLGFGVRVAMRRFRAKVAGKIRYGQAWWQRHQERY